MRHGFVVGAPERRHIPTVACKVHGNGGANTRLAAVISASGRDSSCPFVATLG